jgi:hypothetical protein
MIWRTANENPFALQIPKLTRERSPDLRDTGRGSPAAGAAWQ